MLGQHHISVGESRFWSVGPSDLFLSYQKGEIRLGSRQIRGAEAQQIKPFEPEDERGELVDFNITRYSVSTSSKMELNIAPLLAPLPLVVTLREPVILPPKSVTQVFVTTPVWLGVYAAESRQPLHEYATLQLKQTWFGPNARDGQVCLACTNKGTIHADFLTHHPLRALTRLDVTQNNDEPFQFEKLKLPMPSLNLYRDDVGHLHTDGLEVQVERDQVRLKFSKELNFSNSKSLEKICKARHNEPRGLERALTAMLG